VTRVDLATSRTVATITVRRGALDVAATPGGRLGDQLRQRGDSVARIDPETNRVAYGAGAAWMGNWHDNSVSRIDPETNRVVGRRSRSGSAPATWWSALAASGSPATTARMARPRTWWLCASTRRPTERSRRSPSVVTPSMSRQPRTPSGVSVADPGTVLRIAGR
jgi:hypothetical protein